MSRSSFLLIFAALTVGVSVGVLNTFWFVSGKSKGIYRDITDQRPVVSQQNELVTGVPNDKSADTLITEQALTQRLPPVVTTEQQKDSDQTAKTTQQVVSAKRIHPDMLTLMNGWQDVERANYWAYLGDTYGLPVKRYTAPLLVRLVESMPLILLRLVCTTSTF